MKIYRLYLTDAIDSLLNEEFVCEATSIDAILIRAEAELQDRGFKQSPYWRYLAPPEGIFVDFGSWSKFLFIQNATIGEVFNS